MLQGPGNLLFSSFWGPADDTAGLLIHATIPDIFGLSRFSLTSLEFSGTMNLLLRLERDWGRMAYARRAE